MVICFLWQGIYGRGENTWKAGRNGWGGALVIQNASFVVGRYQMTSWKEKRGATALSSSSSSGIDTEGEHRDEE